MSLVPLGAVAALGGAYSAATLPLLAAAVVVFLAVRARVLEDDARLLDAALIALAAGALVQSLPLPGAIVASLSPQAGELRGALHLATERAPATLSVNPRLTRAGLATLVTALLVFWAARTAFGRGGIRTAARALAWGGFALALVAFAGRATAPDLLMWRWTPADPGAQPFGPFLNRNHFATWLLMAAALTAGYLAAHSRSHRVATASLRLRLHDWLADGHGLVLSGALLAMLAGIAATLSRAAILGAGVALAAGAAMARGQGRGRATRVAAVCGALLLAAGIWSNRDGLARKFDAASTIGRVAIWQETLPVVGDFWLTGTGLGTYGPTMLHYQRRMRELHFNQAHSEYLQVAAEGGLLLLVPLAVAGVAGLRLARRRLEADQSAVVWLRIGAAAGLLAVAVQGLFETGLRIPANGILAALLAAVLLHAREDR